MRIAFDVSYIQKKRAGIGRYALQLIKSLLRYDTRIDYVLHGWSLGLDRGAISLLETQRTRLAVARIPGEVKRFYWNRLRMPVIETLIGDVQVFHSMDPFLPPTRTTKTICTVYDLVYKIHPGLLESRVPLWGRYVERSIHTANAIIVPSQQTKSDIVEMLKVDSERIHVLQLPVEQCFTSIKNEHDGVVKEKFSLTKPYLLFAGTIEPRKNVTRIVTAFERIHSRYDVDLVLVGKKGWLYEKTFQAINESPMKSHIHYLDYVDDNDLASLYRNALCFVYPSIYEGYGFPILEAMASGVPIITSNNSSMCELADGVGVLVDPSSEDEIAAAMELLINDETRRKEMQLRGLRRIELFTRESAARKVLDLYSALTAS